MVTVTVSRYSLAGRQLVLTFDVDRQVMLHIPLRVRAGDRRVARQAGVADGVVVHAVGADRTQRADHLAAFFRSEADRVTIGIVAGLGDLTDGAVAFAGHQIEVGAVVDHADLADRADGAADDDLAGGRAGSVCGTGNQQRGDEGGE